jgi:hypothetical protein
MRTTVELPSELMRRAKARAAERGESLKTLLARAVSAELGRSAGPEDKGAQVRLPLFGNPRLGVVDISARDIAHALAQDDAVGAGQAARRQK